MKVPLVTLLVATFRVRLPGGAHALGSPPPHQGLTTANTCTGRETSVQQWVTPACGGEGDPHGLCPVGLLREDFLTESACVSPVWCSGAAPAGHWEEEPQEDRVIASAACCAAVCGGTAGPDAQTQLQPPPPRGRTHLP